ncbi:hypothetical protein J1614_010444 [Plenodomus biglobosus]|nr:hypothetical protein J1614_010444 [Plenodomus biglobosus]
MMRITIGLVGLVGLVSTLPTLYNPKPTPSNTYLTSALAIAGDSIVCQGTLDSGSCETINAQGTCITLGNNAFHKARNIYQAKGSVCKYFEKDCSAPQAVVSINSNERNLWLDLTPEIGDRIGLVLCRNDWPQAQHAEVEIEEEEEKKEFSPCHFDNGKGVYVCKDKAAVVKGRAAEPEAALITRQFPHCPFNRKNGVYDCKGQDVAPPSHDTVAKGFPPCYFNTEKGRYICDHETHPEPDKPIIAGQSPHCHVGGEKGENICVKATPAAHKDEPQLPATSVRLCNDHQGCINEDAKTCLILPGQYFHGTQVFRQKKGSSCRYYHQDCSAPNTFLWEQVTREADVMLSGPAVARFGAVKCELLQAHEPVRRLRRSSLIKARAISTGQQS